MEKKAISTGYANNQYHRLMMKITNIKIINLKNNQNIRYFNYFSNISD